MVKFQVRVDFPLPSQGLLFAAGRDPGSLCGSGSGFAPLSVPSPGWPQMVSIADSLTMEMKPHSNSAFFNNFRL